jgi:hypothetical protein
LENREFYRGLTPPRTNCAISYAGGAAKDPGLTRAFCCYGAGDELAGNGWSGRRWCSRCTSAGRGGPVLVDPARPPQLWRIEGRVDPQLVIGTLAGLMMGLGIVFASRAVSDPVRMGAGLHRDLRHLLGPAARLRDRGALGRLLDRRGVFFRGALMPVVGLTCHSAVFALFTSGPSCATCLDACPRSWRLMFGQLFLWSGDLTGAWWPLHRELPQPPAPVQHELR